MTEITVEIVRHIGIINTNKMGWTRELNVVAWNGGSPKYDVREWDPDHERMTRGITFTAEEGCELLKLLSREFDK